MKHVALFLFGLVLAIGGWSRLNRPAFIAETEHLAVNKTIAIRPLTLKEGVSPDEFERFWTEEFLPVGDQFYHVSTSMLMKGDRGTHANGYIWHQEFRSVEARDWYFNRENPGNWWDVYEACARCQEVQEKLSAYIEEDIYEDYTDYVEVK